MIKDTSYLMDYMDVIHNDLKTRLLLEFTNLNNEISKRFDKIDGRLNNIETDMTIIKKELKNITKWIEKHD